MLRRRKGDSKTNLNKRGIINEGIHKNMLGRIGGIREICTAINS